MTNQTVHGVGLGLRTPHLSQILQDSPSIPWFELLADNHLAAGGAIPVQTAAICERYPVSLHCVGMNLGGIDPLDFEYLERIRQLAESTQATAVSDHVCFTRTNGIDHHDLLPLPYTEEALTHLSKRIQQVQDFLGRRIMVENASAYLSYQHSRFSESEFLSALAESADCALLIDVNNLYVNQINLHSDAAAAIDQLPLDRIGQIHLGGHEDNDDFLIDAHNNRVAEPVWQLYQRLQARKPGCPTLIEWDNDIPEFSVLLEEKARADRIMQSAYKTAPHGIAA